MRYGDGRLLVCSLLVAVWSCEGSKAQVLTAERMLKELPQAEISTDPNVLAPFVGWALNQVLSSLRYWNIMNVEAALDFVGGEPGPPVLFAGLPLGESHPLQAPVRVPRRQDENPCPARVDRSETPTGKIDLDLLGGCESTVGGFPVRYDGRIRLEGDFGLGALRVDYEWTKWKEETPFGSRTVNGTQTMESAFQPGGEYSVSIRRELRGATGTAESIAEVFAWNVSGQDGEEAGTTGSWLLASGSSTSALRADLRATAAATEKTPGAIPPVTEGTLEIGLASGAPISLFSGSSSGRLIVRLEGVRRDDCGAGGAEPTAGRLILESLNAVEINFADECDGCGILVGDGRKVCWAEAAPEEKPGGAPLEPPPEPIAPEPPVPPTPAVPVPVLEPTFTAEIQIVANQVSLPSQDVAVALPEGYRTVNIEGDVSGIFFDRAEGVRGLAVTSTAEAGSLAGKLGEAFKKGVRVNGTSMPPETTATISTVNSLRLTSVDGKPMTLQTFSLGFSAPRAWEGVTTQLAAAVGASGKTDVSMPGIDASSVSGVSSKEYVAMVGSVPREVGKSLHAAAVVPLESFDERSVEMFQTVGAATRANVRLVKKEETFVAQAQGPQINVSSSVVDVLWVIDDSGSMSEEQANLATNFDSFFRQFRALNLDYHLGVVTSDCDKTSSSSSSYKSKALCGTLRKLSNGAVYIDPNTSQAESEWATISRPGTSGSGNEKPLLAAREALTSRVTDKSNSGFRRADASLVVILVTDEEDQSYEGVYTNSRAGSTYTPYTPPAPFTQFMQTQGAAVFTITGDPADSYSTGGCSSVNGSAEPGNAVIEVAESSGGSWASICSSTFAPTLSLISQSIGTRASRFKLSQPALPSRIRVFVDGVEVRRSLTQKVGGALQTQDGFVYDIVSRTISFAGTRFTPKPGETVRVVYLVVEGAA